MGVVQNIIGMVRDINDHRENAKIEDALKSTPNYLNDPTAAAAAVQNVAQISQPKAIALQQTLAQQQAARDAAQAAAIKARQDRLGLIAHTLRTAPQDQVGAAFDRFTPLFTKYGADPTEIAALKEQAMADPNFLSGMDDKAYEAMFKDQHTSTVATAGSDVLRGGQVVDRVPYGYKPVTVGSSQTGYHTGTFDPNTGRWGTPGGAPERGAPGSPGARPSVEMAPPSAPPAEAGLPAWSDPGSVTAEALLPHFKAQESGGNYTVVSPQGAMGAYQIMPATGRTIAKNLGLAWRPDMMQKDDPASRRYQDAIGLAAAQEAVQAGGGDPATTFAYYHGGSDRAKWGPKTAQYVKDMEARVGLGRPDGQAATVNSDGITVPAAPPKPQKSTRQLSPEELKAAGYPDGSVVQVDSTGKADMVYRPPNPKAGTDPTALRNSYTDAKASLAELRKNISDVINDPDLGYATGYLGAVEKHGFGNTRTKIEARLKQINTQKLLSLVTALKQNGGNPFSRITNYEAQILPTTLGDFNLNQSADDLRATGNRALDQLNALEHRMDSGASSAGLLTPQPPAVGEVHKGYRFKGGDPSNQSSWEKVK